MSDPARGSLSAKRTVSRHGAARKSLRAGSLFAPGAPRRRRRGTMRGVRFRVAYEHPTDGFGEVTRWLDQPMGEETALEAAGRMRASGDYLSVTVEKQDRPGTRWSGYPLAGPAGP